MTTGTIGGLRHVLAALPPGAGRARGPRLPGRRRDDPGRRPGRSATCRPPQPVTDLAGCVAAYVTPAHQHPLGRVMSGADRLSAAGRGPSRRRGGDRGRLRLRVPLRRRAGAGPGGARPRPSSPTSAPPASPSHRACGWAGWSLRPACTDAILDRRDDHPRRRARGRSSGRSSPCCATGTSTRSSAPPAGCTPSGRRAGRRRARAVRRADPAARRHVLHLPAAPARRASGPRGSARARASR